MSCNRHCTAFDPVASLDDIYDILRTILTCRKAFSSNFSTSVLKVVRISGPIVAAVLTDARVDDKITFCTLLAMANCSRWNLSTLSLTISSTEMSEVVLSGLGCVVVDVLDFAMDHPSLVPSSFSI